MRCRLRTTSSQCCASFPQLIKKRERGLILNGVDYLLKIFLGDFEQFKKYVEHRKSIFNGWKVSQGMPVNVLYMLFLNLPHASTIWHSTIKHLLAYELMRNKWKIPQHAYQLVCPYWPSYLSFRTLPAPELYSLLYLHPPMHFNTPVTTYPSKSKSSGFIFSFTYMMNMTKDNTQPHFVCYVCILVRIFEYYILLFA